MGIAKVSTAGLFGIPTLYTTYERAIQYIPNPRYTISYVLVEPKSASDIPKIKQQVEALGYLALTKEEFMQRTSDFYMFQTGVGTNILIMTVISFIVGLSISGSNVLHVHSGKSGKVRSPESHRHEKPRTDRHDSVPGRLHGPHRLRAGSRLVHAVDLACKLRLPSYAAMMTYTNLCSPSRWCW